MFCGEYFCKSGIKIFCVHFHNFIIVIAFVFIGMKLNQYISVALRQCVFCLLMGLDCNFGMEACSFHKYLQYKNVTVERVHPDYHINSSTALIVQSFQYFANAEINAK